MSNFHITVDTVVRKRLIDNCICCRVTITLYGDFPVRNYRKKLEKITQSTKTTFERTAVFNIFTASNKKKDLIWNIFEAVTWTNKLWVHCRDTVVIL